MLYHVARTKDIIADHMLSGLGARFQLFGASMATITSTAV